MWHVQLRSLRKSFGASSALNGLELGIQAGEFVSLLGPSGCGKTTTLRIVAGFETADTGHILVNGADITHVPSSKRDMGMVFQSYSLFPNMTAQVNVEFGLRVRRISSIRRQKRAAELLELVGLSERADHFPHQLSGGQQQRVALARALAATPQVLLLDEPLSALDANVRATLREEIRRIQSELGITTLFVTHNQEEALSMSDRVGVMREGRLEQLAAPSTVYQEPATEFVATFIGAGNILPAVAHGNEVVVYGQRITAPAAARHGRGTDVNLVLRPEEIRIAPVQDADPGALTGVVMTRSFLGPVTRVSVKLEHGTGQVIRVDIPASADELPPGARAALSFKPANPLLLRT
ncbi:ABC transporter ATP-binding protein [Streptomyces sp. NBC_01017]|uniref:ABC-type quaternary amine transporter n=2 Tax=Streptomyces TaxID=1883 RepID=A0AAU1IBL5_9ACTN|nr:ABC transporter ATP-binding protein [Streptomyces sp. NBC_01017]